MAQVENGAAASIAILKSQGLIAERVIEVKINLDKNKIATITVTYALDIEVVEKIGL